MRYTLADFQIGYFWLIGRNALQRLAPESQCPGGRGSRGPGGTLSEKRLVMRTRFKNLLVSVLAGFLAAGAATESPGCTDFRIEAADGTVIIGRTMDFEVPVLSFVRIFPRGERWSSDAPGTTGGSVGPRDTAMPPSTWAVAWSTRSTVPRTSRTA